MSFDASMTTRGALFDQARPIIDQGLSSSLATLGDEAASRVRQRLDIVLRNPSGFYRSRVVSEVTPTIVTVNDSNVIYGPWLEGVGSRNATTRFKGYASFRKIAQRVSEDAALIVATDVNAMAARLEG
jgi:hypothetical protein